MIATRGGKKAPLVVGLVFTKQPTARRRPMYAPLGGAEGVNYSTSVETTRRRTGETAVERAVPPRKMTKGLSNDAYYNPISRTGFMAAKTWAMLSPSPKPGFCRG